MLECYNDAIILGGSVQFTRFILINVIPFTTHQLTKNFLFQFSVDYIPFIVYT